jgi:hypothetical protein
VAATFVLSNVGSAQEFNGSALDAITRDVDRYAACWFINDATCFNALTDPRVGVEVGVQPRGVGFPSDIRGVQFPRSPPPVLELAKPWGPYASAERLIGIVPYFTRAIDVVRGRRLDRTGYLIASSYDSGQSWRFVMVESVTPMLEDWMDRLAPGTAEPQWPDVVTLLVDEPDFERSRSLRTTARQFVQVEDGFVYAMTWEVRSEITDTATLVIRYENPADRSGPFSFRGSLQPGQQTLEWNSPVLTGFESGQLYDVVVEVSDPDTGEMLFDHRQPVLFDPTLELWKTEMSTPQPREDPDGSALDPATRDAEAYVACWMTANEACVFELSDRKLHAETGIALPTVGEFQLDSRSLQTASYETISIELAQPWGPFTSGERLTKIVPYFDLAIDGTTGRRWERTGYLIASSYDNGQSWRFANVRAVTVSVANWMARLNPGVEEPQWPEVSNRLIEEPGVERSRWMWTTGRRFVQIDDGFVYAMRWEVRQEFAEAVSFAISYDDPADRSRPLRFRGSLEPGQQALEWNSPVLTGFESGQIYEVVVEASDADTGELIFEHRQPMLFEPTLETWRAAMATSPASNPGVAPSP